MQAREQLATFAQYKQEREEDLKAVALEEEKAAQEIVEAEEKAVAAAAQARVVVANRTKYADVKCMQDRLAKMTVCGHNSGNEP